LILLVSKNVKLSSALERAYGIHYCRPGKRYLAKDEHLQPEREVPGASVTPIRTAIPMFLPP
jgi:hypothetical protein